MVTGPLLGTLNTDRPRSREKGTGNKMKQQEEKGKQKGEEKKISR